MPIFTFWLQQALADPIKGMLGKPSRLRTQISLNSGTLLPPATKLGQGYVFTGVCDSVHSGGVPDQVHPPGPGTPPGTRYTPRTRYTLRNQVHPRTRYPPAQSMLGDTVNARAVRILLECNLVGNFANPLSGKQP